jgi:hypothetical protein
MIKTAMISAVGAGIGYLLITWIKNGRESVGSRPDSDEPTPTKPGYRPPPVIHPYM